MIHYDFDPAERAFADMMHAGNAEMLLRLATLVSIPADRLSGVFTLMMIAALRERHTTMPAGREISDSLQTSLERALVQARLHLMRTPGAAEGFRVAAGLYAAELEARRALVQQHLEALAVDAVSALGAIEWCERLVTKFTAQEIARPCLADYAAQLSLIYDRLIRFDEAVGNVLGCTIALLNLGQAVSANAVDRVRQSLPGFAMMAPEAYTDQMMRVAAR
jgi:hypothetical protein